MTPYQVTWSVAHEIRIKRDGYDYDDDDDADSYITRSY